jgi:hypothetical protein
MEKGKTDAESRRLVFPKESSPGAAPSHNDEVYTLPFSTDNVQFIARQLGSLSSRTALNAEDDDMPAEIAVSYILRGLLSLFNSIAVSPKSAPVPSVDSIHLEGLSIHVDLC